MLNILERYDLKADGPRSPADPPPRDRGDAPRLLHPRHRRSPTPTSSTSRSRELISKAYADELARTITDRATPSASLAPFPILDAEGSDTTHLSTLDADGNAVALTYTLEEGYGSKAVVAGAGFLLNNEMGDFNLIPGRTDAAGRIGTAGQPDRRRQADAQLAVADDRAQGRPGPPRHRLARRPDDPQHDALGRPQRPGVRPRSPRGRRRAADPPPLVPRRPDPRRPGVATGPHRPATALAGLGHTLQVGGIQGDAHTIVVDPDRQTIHGVADRRRETSRAAGD